MKVKNKKIFLGIIKQTNQAFPFAEYIIKLPYCEYVDSVAGEIDGIAKFVTEKEINEFLDELYKIDSEIELNPIKKTFKVGKSLEKKNVEFWMKFKIVETYVNLIKNFLQLTKSIIEAYLTDKNFLYVRGESNSISEVSDLWDKLFSEIGYTIDTKEKMRTYFIFRRFEKSN